MRAFRRGEGANRVRLPGVRREGACAGAAAARSARPGTRSKRRSSARRRRRARTGGTAAHGRRAGRRRPARPLRLAEIDVADFDRLPVGIEEFGRVLGGGIVRGSLVLIGGDPGVGKSTLLAQVCDEVAQAERPGPVRLGRGVAGADRAAGAPAGPGRARTCCSPATPTSARSSRRSRTPGRAWSWSTRSRASTAPTSSRRRAASASFASARCA